MYIVIEIGGDRLLPLVLARKVRYGTLKIP